MDFASIDTKIVELNGFALSSPYQFGPNLGQPAGVKSTGFIELVAEDGTVGVGETYVGVYSPELLKPVAEFLSKFVIGTPVGSANTIENLRELPFVGRDGLIRSIASGVEIALWDLRGKMLGQPVWRLLQGKRSVQGYASGGSAASDKQALLNDIELARSMDFPHFKMRAGWQDWDTDLSRIAMAVDNLVGKSLMVDFIMGTLRPPWTLQEAKSKLRQLEDLPIYWAEEPLFPDDFSGYSALRTVSKIPIAAGEAFSSRSDYDSLLNSNCIDILQFDATHSGGISECISLAKKAMELNLASAVHVWGSAVAIAANTALAGAGPGVDFVEVPIASLDINHHLWVDPPQTSNGQVTLSDAPGLGVSLTRSTKELFPLVPGSGYSLK